MSVPPATAGRPTVDQVAVLLRARTKDEFGVEVGTFDSSTRPTAEQAEEQIDAACRLIAARIPPLDKLSAEVQDTVAEVVAYRAALRIEKSYFPEQVQTGRSAYEQLHQEYLEEVQALMDALAKGTEEGGDAIVYGFASLPVGSWTSIPHDWIELG